MNKKVRRPVLSDYQCLYWMIMNNDCAMIVLEAERTLWEVQAAKKDNNYFWMFGDYLKLILFDPSTSKPSNF